MSQDYLEIDDPITITLRVKTGEGQYTNFTVEYAQKNAVSKEYQQIHNAALENDTSAFHLWTANLHGQVPKLDDIIVDDGGASWRALQVSHMDRDANGVQRYRCSCNGIDA